MRRGGREKRFFIPINIYLVINAGHFITEIIKLFNYKIPRNSGAYF